jgi:MFS transporter, ACS family, aldohexuronate transporter
MVTPAQHRLFAWLIAAFFFAGSVLSFVDRAVLGVVMPQVRADLSLTNTEYSLATTSFLIMYMIFYILGGQLADRLGSRRTFSLNIIFWSLASIAHAVARGLASLCVFRGLLGMGEGGFFPTAMRGIAEWFPPENRAKAVGLLMCGISLGMLVTAPLVAWITLHYGWRMAFLLTGALGFLVIPPWLLLHRRIQEAYGMLDPVPAQNLMGKSVLSNDSKLGEVLTRRRYWLFLLARAFPDTVTFFYLFWLPGYFQAARHYDLEKVGKLLWIPFFCADVGALGGAWLSSSFIQRGMGLDKGRKLALFLSAICPIVGAAAYLAPTHSLALALVSLALFGHFSWSSNMQTVITEVMPRKHVATLYGLTGAAGTLMAAITQSLVGRAVDSAGYGPAFLGTAGAYVLALVMLFSAGRIEQIS